MKQPQRRVLILSGELPDEDLGTGIEPLHLEVRNIGDHTSFELLDTHVGSVRRADQLLLRSGKQLTMLLGAGQVMSQDASPKHRFVNELDDGPVKSALQHAPRLRSLLSAGSGTISHRDLSVTDDDDKTLARARLTTLFPEGDGQAITITDLQPLRGYGKAMDQLRAHLEAAADSAPNRSADLAAMLFPDQVRYDAKPDVAIAMDDTAGHTANRIIAAYLQVARQNEAGIIADHDTEFLHDYRVALRKVRSVLSLFKGAYSEERTAEFKRIASELMAPTGRLRDLDVYLLAQDDYFAMLPETLHEGLGLMFGMLRKERRKTHRRLSARLVSDEYDSTMRAFMAAFADPDGAGRGPEAGTGIGDFGSRLIWKRYRKVCRLARTITADTPDEQVHELRILCKKLRYLMEFFAPLYPAAAVKPILKPLKRLQDNLGLFNDYSVQQTFLQDFLDRHEPLGHKRDLALAQSIGALIAVLHERQKEERARIMTSFLKFDGAEIRSRFGALFHDKET